MSARGMAVVRGWVQWSAAVLLIYAGFSLGATAGEPVHHRLSVALEPAAGRITVTDRLRVPDDGGEVLRFQLAAGLEVEAEGARLGRALPPIALSSARTRWGSCSQASGIRFNWRLIHLPTHLVDYVVAHELAHLVEMNHSPRFWAEVGRLYPDWRAARAELKLRGREIPLI